jgi:hypothetical protein
MKFGAMILHQSILSQLRQSQLAFRHSFLSWTDVCTHAKVGNLDDDTEGKVLTKTLSTPC